MKVLHLMNDLRASGMERMFISASDHFQELGVESLIVGQGQAHPFKGELEAAGYRVATTPKIKSVSGLRAYMALLRKEHPDVVHIHSEGAYAVAVILSKLATPKVAIVRTVHNVFQPTGLRRALRLLETRTADRFVSAIVAVSPDVQANERSFGRETELIYNWVDERFFELRERRKETEEEGPPTVAIVGNSSPIKNHELALSVIEDMPVDLAFHGDERDANPAEKAILDRLGAEGRLKYRGTGDPGETLVNAAAYAMPSRKEGMSIALAEALVVGVPAVISDAPGMSWAKHFPNVSVIDFEKDSWREALTWAVSNRGREVSELPADLTPATGARNYRDLYVTAH